MDIKEIATKIINIYQDEKDGLVKLLSILDLAKNSDVNEIIDIYNKVKKGEIKIVKIISSIKLSTAQQKTLEEKITNSVKGELIFDYQLDISVTKGINIRINDTKIDIDSNWY